MTWANLKQMTDPQLPHPEETPPAEGATADAHEERADGGIWEHPGLWVSVIAVVTISMTTRSGFGRGGL